MSTNSNEKHRVAFFSSSVRFLKFFKLKFEKIFILLRDKDNCKLLQGLEKSVRYTWYTKIKFLFPKLPNNRVVQMGAFFVTAKMSHNGEDHIHVHY